MTLTCKGNMADVFTGKQVGVCIHVNIYTRAQTSNVSHSLLESRCRSVSYILIKRTMTYIMSNAFYYYRIGYLMR